MCILYWFYIILYMLINFNIIYLVYDAMYNNRLDMFLLILYLLSILYRLYKGKHYNVFVINIFNPKGFKNK